MGRWRIHFILNGFREMNRPFKTADCNEDKLKEAKQTLDNLATYINVIADTTANYEYNKETPLSLTYENKPNASNAEPSGANSAPVESNTNVSVRQSSQEIQEKLHAGLRQQLHQIFEIKSQN
jgi:hypothetical protein